ncbi:Uu.00g084040.m01.CDS01 [Anthostomella pinea]|uniref:Phosphoinositide phospholipase C n=1 Tax=Anthostomella pinea TaxID=933095 RepID=A0AAI8YJT1_9PEZI|nr:Uu.00g084040.m01.CDS01 [Anthostomella pinea]
MAAQGSLLQRARPCQVQTSQATGTSSVPTSAPATSASSVASTSHKDSPTMSPEHTVLTTSSSTQQSPDPNRGRGAEEFPPPPAFHLGDPLLSRKPSSNSMNPSVTTSHGSMAEAMGNGGGRALMRRLSNKATSKFSRTRRQSSAAPNSRNGSIGPGILRRRSDSTNTAPAAEGAMYTDSDDEYPDEMNELYSLIGAESMSRGVSSGSTAASIAGSTSTPEIPAAPVVPLALIKGTYLAKISKKKKFKRMLFNLEYDTGKIVWDKGRSSKCLYIDDIKEVRIGSDIRQYRIDYEVPEPMEARFFTINYSVPDKSRTKTMHLVAEDEETFTHWVTALDSISKHREVHMASLMAFNDNAVRSFWNGEMAKQFENRPHSSDEEAIDFPGVQRVCRNLHIHMAHKDLLIKFAIADTSRTGRLNFSEFQAFVREMKQREDVRAIYREHASDVEKGITCEDFMKFLREVQFEDVDNNRSLWEARFIRYAYRVKPKDVSLQRVDRDSIRMTEEALAAYLASKDNDPLVREPSEYSLDRPFNEYFISSSHNTYLVGRQIADVSSVEGYIMTLMRGCRSVEIDCWDGSDGQPTVKHGYAMTNSISFREVINTVNKYAFIASHFPLWVSLEVHCNAAQQEIMAEMMKEIFGSRLVTEPLDSSADKLPSPSELKDRILIKVKGTHRTPEQHNGSETSGRRRGNSLTSPFSKPVIPDIGGIPVQNLTSSPLLGPTQSSRRTISKRVETITEGEVHDNASSSTSDCDTEEEKPGKRKTSKIVQSLGDLGVYCSGVKFHGFDTADCKKSNHILSFMEGTFRKHSKAGESKKALTRHNMRYMMRVYPQYSRFSSDNFNPLMYWRRGVQMAALNWQTFDFGMQLNQAMFDGGTDQSGYVLKPESMRQIRVLAGAQSEEAIGKLVHQKLAFRIDVISAQQLMRPASLASTRSLDPYVEVEVFHTNDKRDKHDSMAGIPILSDTPLKVVTPVVKENGFNPEFNHAAKFDVTTKHPELIFVKFSVKLSTDGESSHNRNTTIATYTAKLSSLKQGYRTLPLLDCNGDQYLFSRLFCNIRVEAATNVQVPNPETGVDLAGKKGFARSLLSRSSNANGAKPTTQENKYSIDSGYSDTVPPTAT